MSIKTEIWCSESATIDSTTVMLQRRSGFDWRSCTRLDFCLKPSRIQAFRNLKEKLKNSQKSRWTKWNRQIPQKVLFMGLFLCRESWGWKGRASLKMYAFAFESSWTPREKWNRCIYACRIYFVQVLDGLAALEKESKARADASSYHDGGRCSEAKCARTRDGEHREREFRCMLDHSLQLVTTLTPSPQGLHNIRILMTLIIIIKN